MKSTVNGFVEFIREQGVVGLAVGFVFGTAVSKLVTSFVNDIINPFVGLIIGSSGGLRTASVRIGSATIAWGNVVATLIDFVIIAFLVYVALRLLHIDKIDKKKS